MHLVFFNLAELAIERLPIDAERLRQGDDPRQGYMAYVPLGSLARGRALVESGRAPESGSTTRLSTSPASPG